MGATRVYMAIEDFKLERFKKDFPDAEFPTVHATPYEQCVDLKREFAQKLGLATNAASIQLLETLYSSFLKGHAGTVATDPGFNLDTLLRESGVKTPQQVYLNRNQFDHIDELKFADLVEYFHYFWYPSSDDIEIFDDGLCWVALIRHDGAVRVVHLE
jgi:hypothetical protein